MSNPTPILNNINAFDATQGTTISFNIIGGTDIVRSNIVYIYDLSTNDLICTHLYISTESVHELPPNTDPSIVYASGKSSEDFINNKNYYLQIQTFTNTAGTAGGSGMSVAKTFWCLFSPALSVNAIPAAISTTSYNVGATYTTNITDVTIPVTNIIQQYKFDLYTATGTLVQTSGNIIGSGEQEGISTTYNITYNFSGLVVNNSYYVVITTTSTEGMTVSAQSNTFTVSIETPTVGAATATNNSCDGYISVVSNLSGEYGGSASGEIASFETDSVNNVSSLKVNMEPIQDLHGYDHPWVGGAGKQLIPITESAEYIKYGVTISIGNDGVVAFEGTSTSAFSQTFVEFDLPEGSYVFSGFGSTAQSTGGNTYIYVRDIDGSRTLGEMTVGNTERRDTFTLTTQTRVRFYMVCSGTGLTLSGQAKVLLADASVTDTSYAPYSNICPISGWDSVEAYDTGVNVWDEEWEVGALKTSDGTPEHGTATIRSKNFCECLPSTVYFAKCGNYSVAYYLAVYWYDENENLVSREYCANRSVTSPADARYFKITTNPNSYVYGTIYNHDISINYPSTDTEYHTYQGQTYTTSLNQTVYGGTVDMATGVLTVDRAMVDLGALDWIYDATRESFATSERFEVAKPTTQYIPFNAVCSSYMTDSSYNTERKVNDGAISLSASRYLRIYDTSAIGKTATEFKAYLNGVQLCYELAAPQTYQLTPHQIQTLVGQNNIWSDAGNVEVTFNLPITNLLVKRQDTSDTSGKWLTLYSQPITQASDMDFTYIDFLNQHGKTYRYALVPLLTQQQGDVDVEIEGGYTVSDDVLSVFDGVFIANSNGSQKLKASTEYGDLETNQDVGVLTTIGGKYPFVVSNSNLNYHSGSVSALIVPSDFYTDGDLDRLDIVERREAIEQFLTDKTAKILKDWNGNIWLITFIDNVEVSFVDDYGMGLGALSAKWVEIGDVNDQTDLQQTGLI